MRGSQAELLDSFLRLGFLSPDALRSVRAESSRQGLPAVEAALLSGVLHPDARGWLLADALGIPFLEVDPEAVPLSLAEILPEEVARENLSVPVSREEGRCTVAVADPFRGDAVSRIERMTGHAVRIVVSPARTIARILDRFYPEALPIPPGDLEGGAIGREEAEEWLARGRGRRMAEKVLLHAVRSGMSTVRIYPLGRKMVIDGDTGAGRSILLSFPLPSRRAVIEAFQELGDLPGSSASVGENTFQMETSAGVRAFRITVLRGLSGSEAVIKVLPDLRSVIPLDSIGFLPDQMELTRRLLSGRDGLILVSAPGAEGVATTIFAMIRDTYRSHGRIVTVEETHRFRNDGYIQLERGAVEGRFGGNWIRLADTLDPDVLAVERVSGRKELHDLVHIARKGVPVFCGADEGSLLRTLRTLFSLEVDPFLLVRVVRLVLHQRLVDLLCPDCRQAVPAVPSLRLAGDRCRERLEPLLREVSFYVRTGCSRCRGTGHAGKMALIDLLPFTPGVQNQVLSDAPLEERIARIVEEDLQSAVPSAVDLLRRGMVTFDEVLPLFR